MPCHVSSAKQTLFSLSGACLQLRFTEPVESWRAGAAKKAGVDGGGEESEVGRRRERGFRVLPRCHDGDGDARGDGRMVTAGCGLAANLPRDGDC